ncbi:hypothetical protein [Shewanella sp. YIC-542]|uniref:hypothetical protein n=1 Tax=Shewanella mytili TaxID=3377111 RepID=UPI00398F33C0
MFKTIEEDERNPLIHGIAIIFAVIWLVVIIKGGYLFFTEEALARPLFTFTNPAWALFLLPLILMGLNVYPLLICFTLFALPILASATFSMIYWPMSHFVLGADMLPFGDMTRWFVTLAYGPLAEQMNYFAVGNQLSSMGAYKYFVPLLMAFGALGVMAILPTAHHALAQSLAERRELELDIPSPLPVMLEYLLRFIGLGLFYNVIYPLFTFAGSLPAGLNYLAIWSLLLMPIMGMGLASLNWSRPRQEKLATGVVIYFCVALVVLLLAYVGINRAALLQQFTGMLAGKWHLGWNLMFLLSGLFAVFMGLSVLRQGAGASADISDD